MDNNIIHFSSHSKQPTKEERDQMRKDGHFPIIEKIIEGLSNPYIGLIKQYAEQQSPRLNKNQVDRLLRRVADEFDSISDYIKQSPEDCHNCVSRWFEIMETYSTTPLQKGDLRRLRQQFEPLFETSSQDEVQTGTGSVIDFSHMKSFSPVKDLEFDMSAVYKLLIDSSVFEDIDYQLFSNSISHAYINELWGNDTRGRNRNLLQCLFKILAQRYPEQWIKKCATNLGVRVRQITNPTTSGNTKSFEEKLWQVLRTKAPK